MLQTFDCPKCGAPVSYEKDVIGANLTARCPYCNSSLSVPDEMYVTDFKGIQVFDGNGRYLTVFDPGGTASGMVFNDKNELLVAARKHVLKLALKEP